MAEIMICGGIFDMNDVNIVWDYLIGTRKDLSDAGELNAVMNPDNINDDYFTHNENHIYQPKTCTSKDFILIASDGCSIEHTRYSTKKEAYEHMSKAYNELNRNEPGDEWSEQSYITEDSAILYDQGENVYLWSVIGSDSSCS